MGRIHVHQLLVDGYLDKPDALPAEPVAMLNPVHVPVDRPRVKEGRHDRILGQHGQPRPDDATAEEFSSKNLPFVTQRNGTHDPLTCRSNEQMAARLRRALSGTDSPTRTRPPAAKRCRSFHWPAPHRSLQRARLGLWKRTEFPCEETKNITHCVADVWRPYSPDVEGQNTQLESHHIPGEAG